MNFMPYLLVHVHCAGGWDNEDSRGVLAAAAVALPSFLPSCGGRPRPLPRWGDRSSVFCVESATTTHAAVNRNLAASSPCLPPQDSEGGR